MEFKLLPLLCFLMAFLSFVSFSEALVEGIYCGTENCYDVLGVTRDDDKNSIMRSYRKLARKLHPDRQRTDEDRLIAEEKFPKIAQAYEILRDDEQRKEYDYMLDNPEEMYYHYYQYFKRRYSPKVDVRIVICVLLTLVSVIQYYSQWSKYNDVLNYVTKDPKYRLQAKEIAKSDGLMDEAFKKRENGRRLTKEELKEREEKVIRQVILEKIDIEGGYSKPSVWRTLWFQLIFLPYHTVVYMMWFTRWVVLFWILKREYGNEEKEHIIRKNLGLSQLQWVALPESEKDSLMKQELWIKEKYAVYAEKKAEENRRLLADSAKYKKMRRYMKKGGAGQITFGQEDVDMDY